jgi:heme-degrading monooxygenase HmoA
MKKISILVGVMILFSLIYAGTISGQSSTLDNSNMIRHTVVFKLKHPKDSPKEKEFLAAIRKLSAIPGVKSFECLRQVSKKNHFEYGLSMEFDSQKAYDDYSNHPDHNTFVQKYWVTEVEDFMELDFEIMR